jgi:hypothetical protein
MKLSNETLPGSASDAPTIKAYFEKVYPTMDFERVYGSDMKKMVRWFDILQKNNVEIKLSEAAGDDAPVDAIAEKKTASSTKTVTPKAAAVKNAPAKKINTPRKMA